MARDGARDVDLTARRAKSWDDEDLPQPRERYRPWLYSVRRPLTFLLVSAVLVFGLVKLNASTGGGGPTAAATSSLGAGSTFIDLSTASVPVNIPTITRGGALTSDAEYATCPDDKSCTTTDQLPPSVLAALAQTYPGAHTVSARTVTVHGDNGNDLLYRAIQYDVGARRLTVQVLPDQEGTPDSGAEVNNQAALVYAQNTVQGHTVRVTVVEPEAKTQSTKEAEKLAADERLLAVA